MNKKILIFVMLLFLVCFKEQAYCETDNKQLIINIHYERGVNFYKQGKYDQAVEELERILEIAPKHAKAKKYLSATIYKKNKGVVKDLSKQADAYYKQKDYQKASDIYNKILELIPNDEYALYKSELARAKVEKSKRLQDKLQSIQKEKTRELEKVTKAEKRKKILKEQEEKKRLEQKEKLKKKQKDKKLSTQKALDEAEKSISKDDKSAAKSVSAAESENKEQKEIKDLEKEMMGEVEKIK